MLKKRIPVFNLEFDSDFRKQFHEQCERIFDEAFLTNHSFVRKFEEKVAGYAGTGYALAVSNGTGALEMILRALDVKSREVLLPTNTFIASSVAILNAGGIPKIIDIEPDFAGMSTEKLEKSISRQTGAVLLVHIGGLVSPSVIAIREICDTYGVPLLEDAAQAFGSHFQGTRAGTFGIAGSFSFFTTKVLTTGEGGAIVTNSENLYQKMRSIRQFGMDPDNSISHIRSGSNFKMSEFNALMGIIELQRFEKRLQKRKQLGERYQKNLKGSCWKSLTPPPQGESNYYKQIVIPPLPRKQVSEHLARLDISLTGGVYFIPLHRQPVYSGMHTESEYPICNEFSDTHICPPCYPELDVEDIDRISEALLDLHR